jgi:hypothetical protein
MNENNQADAGKWAANTTHFPNPLFTKVFPSYAATAHVLLNGKTVATITGTLTASTAGQKSSAERIGGMLGAAAPRGAWPSLGDLSWANPTIAQCEPDGIFF